jgi:hypothetical protein
VHHRADAGRNGRQSTSDSGHCAKGQKFLRVTNQLPLNARRSRLCAGVRLQGHLDAERGTALEPLYDYVRPHLLGQDLDQARAKTGGPVEREPGREAECCPMLGRICFHDASGPVIFSLNLPHVAPALPLATRTLWVAGF